MTSQAFLESTSKDRDEAPSAGRGHLGGSAIDLVAGTTGRNSEGLALDPAQCGREGDSADGTEDPLWQPPLQSHGVVPAGSEDTGLVEDFAELAWQVTGVSGWAAARKTGRARREDPSSWSQWARQGGLQSLAWLMVPSGPAQSEASLRDWAENKQNRSEMREIARMHRDFTQGERA